MLRTVVMNSYVRTWLQVLIKPVVLIISDYTIPFEFLLQLFFKLTLKPMPEAVG
jgi:hypothetical protein